MVRNHHHQRKLSAACRGMGRFTLAMAAAVAAGALAMPVITRAGTTDTFVGPTGGDWSTASNWSNSAAPANGDTAVIDTNVNVTYSATYSNPGLSDLSINSSGIMAELYQTAGAMYVSGVEVVGIANFGEYYQWGGTNQANALELGGATGGYGYYYLGGGTLSTSSTQSIGTSSYGNVDQAGGTNNVGITGVTSANLVLGDRAGGVGVYDISGGNLSVAGGGTIVIVNAGNGTLNIYGTAQASASYLSIGQVAGANSFSQNSQGTSTPVYNMNISGGTFTCAFQSVGNYGFGSVNQTGGTNNVLNGSLEIGSLAGGVGLYQISAGTLNASGAEVDVGRMGTGTLNISGSAQVSMGSLYIGYAAGSSGTVSVSGGSLMVGSAAYYGPIVVGGGGSGTFNVSGSAKVGMGSLVIGNAVGGNGTVNASGGSLTSVAGGAYSGSYGAIIVGASGNGTLNISGSAQASGSYMFVGQTSGSNSTSQNSQSGASPVYNVNISAGSLTTVTNQVIGGSGFGSVNQTGGTNTVGDNLKIGYSNTGAGVYDISGGTLQVAAAMYIGYAASGDFQQSGNSQVTSGSLILGNDVGATGVYTLSGGQLSATTEQIGSLGTGTFTQSGGINAVAQSLV